MHVCESDALAMMQYYTHQSWQCLVRVKGVAAGMADGGGRIVVGGHGLASLCRLQLRK